jgi:hypothetical protein
MREEGGGMSGKTFKTLRRVLKKNDLKIKYAVKNELKQEAGHMLKKLSFLKRLKIAIKVLRGQA